MNEIVWSAGFYDGEGGCYSNRGYPHITICQRHREPLVRFRAAFAAGRIYETVLRDKPLYHYATTSHDETWHVCLRLWPFITEIKRAQMVKAWSTFDTHRKTVARHGSTAHSAKISAARKGKPGRRLSAEARARISASHLLVERA